MKIKRRVIIGLVTVLVVLLLSLGLVLAAGEMLPRSLVSAGGGLVAQSGLNLHSAIGQPAVGAVQNGPTLCSGFLCGPGAPSVNDGGHSLYLPLLQSP